MKKLNDSNVEAGKPIVLECTYTGTAPISVTWQKNGREVYQSNRCSMITTEKSCILEISSSAKDDDGQYVCKVENDVGQDSCQAYLSIIGALHQACVSTIFLFVKGLLLFG